MNYLSYSVRANRNSLLSVQLVGNSTSWLPIHCLRKYTVPIKLPTLSLPFTNFHQLPVWSLAVASACCNTETGWKWFKWKFFKTDLWKFTLVFLAIQLQWKIYFPLLAFYFLLPFPPYSSKYFLPLFISSPCSWFVLLNPSCCSPTILCGSGSSPVYTPSAYPPIPPTVCSPPCPPSHSSSYL